MKFVAGLVVKIIDGAEIQRHDVAVQSWDDLDTWLIQNIKNPFDLLEAESKQAFTARCFHEYVISPDAKAAPLILHARVKHGPCMTSTTTSAESFPVLAPPQNVHIEAKGGKPCLYWSPPKGHAEILDLEYEVRFHGDGVFKVFKTSGVQFEVPSSPDDISCQVTVAAVSGQTVSVPITRWYVVEKEGTDFGKLKNLLRPACQDFDRARGRKQLRVLLVGKQHHGKSSFTNHLMRCSKQHMDIGDEVETGPPSEMETTVDMKPIPVQFEDFQYVICDTPAFSSLAGEKCEQLKTLLERANGGWRRGDATSASLCALMSSPPDAVIIVVSLQAWRDEHDELKEYLAKLQNILKHATPNDIAFPYAVVATHKDVFLHEAGNAGQDPLQKMSEAIEDLKALANTSKVFPVTNYQDDSSWMEKNTETTVRLVRDLTKLAKHVETNKIYLARNTNLQSWCVLAMPIVVLIIALLVKVMF